MLIVELRVGLFAAAIAEVERLECEREVTPEIAASLRGDYEARLAHAAPTALALATGDDPWRRVRHAIVRAGRKRLIAL